MFFFFFFFTIVNASFFNKKYFEQVKAAQNGGVECAGCTVAVTLLEQLSIVHGTSINDELDKLCDYFPINGPRQGCWTLVYFYGSELVRLLTQKYTPDQVCNELSICTNPKCALHPIVSRQSKSKSHVSPKISAVQDNSIWDWLLKEIERVGDHLPEIDVDGDRFSSQATLRGYNWRGRDCDFADASVYPGRRKAAHDASNANCNGITGVAPSGQTWEQELCGGSIHLGVMAIGDSAGAHFEIPPNYLNASLINEHTYDDLLYLLSDEFDRPLRSGYTGFVDTTPSLMANSIYKKMREHNRCIHRDYQNLCVNGARSSVAPGLAKTMARNQTTDHPALVFFELIGNDVCTPHHTTARFSTVPEFRANVMKALRQLDTQLPRGSHVVTVDLADGEVLYQNMHNRTHPLGVKYENVYDFLNCLEINPCWGWLNNNATVRALTQQRADQLSSVYTDIKNTETFNNFQLITFPFPLKAIVAGWKKINPNGELWQLIEPVDSFHPNQIANSLTADWMWNELKTKYPHVIGPANPNNAKIIQLFGDQGGH